MPSVLRLTVQVAGVLDDVAAIVHVSGVAPSVIWILATPLASNDELAPLAPTGAGSAAVKMSVTLLLFHPAPLAGGFVAAVVVGLLLSSFTWSVLGGSTLPALSRAW